jgi:hypothetical protein
MSFSTAWNKKENHPPIIQDHNDTNEKDSSPTTEVETAVQKIVVNGRRP